MERCDAAKATQEAKLTFQIRQPATELLCVLPPCKDALKYRKQVILTKEEGCICIPVNNTGSELRKPLDTLPIMAIYDEQGEIQWISKQSGRNEWRLLGKKQLYV